MRQSKPVRPSVPLVPSDSGPGYNPLSSENPTNKEPPRRPDWLLMLMIGLLLLTVLIIWLVDFPIPFF